MSQLQRVSQTENLLLVPVKVHCGSPGAAKALGLNLKIEHSPIETLFVKALSKYLVVSEAQKRGEAENAFVVNI